MKGGKDERGVKGKTRAGHASTHRSLALLGSGTPEVEILPRLRRPNHRQTPRTKQNIPSSSNSVFPFSWLEFKGESSVFLTLPMLLVSLVMAPEDTHGDCSRIDKPPGF